MRARVAASCLALVACAKAGDGIAIDATPGGDDDTPAASACPPDQFAVDVSATGQVTCVSIDDPTRAAIDDRCNLYLGWRDGCDACTTDPAKWGRIGTTCTSGAGVNNTCTTPSLGGTNVPLFGLDFEGDVDGNDKLYGSLHCATAETTAGVAPCKPGELVVGLLGSTWTCQSVADAVVGYVRASCSLYLGWQDGCDGCATAPVKWGHAGDGGCANGAGADDTCTVAALAGETVNLFGLNPDGDVDGNDKLHVGLDCTAAAADRTTSTTTCPVGQFVTGTLADGSFQCDSVAPLVERYVTGHCAVRYAWQDGCDGCLTPPAKFGDVRVGACTLGAGADDTCTTFSLGGRDIAMFGLNPDGDVDGNDALYLGFQCK